MLKLVIRVLVLFETKNRVPRSKNAILKIIFDYNVILTSPTPYDSYPEEAINRAKCDVSTPGSSEQPRQAHIQTDRIALNTVYLATL